MKHVRELEDGSMSLASGRTVSVTPMAGTNDERIEIRAPGGELELSVLMTSEGPRLKIRALDIELEASRALRMRCQSLDIKVDGDTNVVTGGRLLEQIGGTAIRESGGEMQLEGADVSVAAAQGKVTITANDDLDLKAERILLNADAQPMAMSWEEFQQRAIASSTSGDS